MASVHTTQLAEPVLSAPKNIAIIGLGNRAYKHAIPRISELSALFSVVAGCDKGDSARNRFKDQFPALACFSDVQKLVEWQSKPGNRVDFAYVAVPHFAYEDIIKTLAHAKIHVLREKPAGLSEEFDRCHQYAATGGIRLVTASQSRYSDRLTRLKEWLPLIGNARFIEGTRTLNCSDLGEGWRADKGLSGGGAISDVGWHLLDTIIGLVAQPEPTAPRVLYSELITTRPHQKYDVDDTAFVSLTIPRASQDQNVSCNLRVSRVGQRKIDDVVRRK
ncbi:MAG: hypothetical protein Q9160_004223 [Pyrenula sp. 1 TL-2023]